MLKSVSIFSGNANAPLAAAIAAQMEVPLGRCKVARFSAIVAPAIGGRPPVTMRVGSPAVCESTA